MNDLFLPQLKGGAGGKKDPKKELRAVYERALHQEDVALAIQKYKCNGSIEGHKMLDDHDAIQALYESATDDVKEDIAELAKSLKKFTRIQVFNQVLRRHWEMERNGKLTGRPSKRIRMQEEAALAEQRI